MKIFIFLLSFVLGFILLKLEYIPATICLAIFLIVLFITNKFPLKTVIKYVGTTVFSVILFCVISNVSLSKEYVNDQIFIVKRAKENYIIISNYFSNYYMYEKNNNYDEGDILKISGNLQSFSSTTIESQSDFKEYLKTYCVYNRIYPKKIDVIIDNPFSTKDLENRYLHFYNDDAKFVISAINFGQKDYDSNLINGYQSLNIVSLLANSGLFYIFVIESFILIFSLKLKDKTATIISLIVCFPYLLFNLFSFGLFKVFLVKLVKLIAQNTKKFNEISHIDVLSLVSLFLVLFDPTVIFRLEFVLSYGLSFLFVILMNDFGKGEQNFKGKFKLNLKIKLFLFFFFLPINLYTNNSINFFSIFIQMVFLPVFKCAYFISFVSFYIGYNPILDGVYFVLNKSVNGITNLFPSTNAPAFNAFHLTFYYIMLFFFLIIVEKKIRPLQKGMVAFGVVSLVIYFLPLKNTFTAEISFINVGQGDSILIRDGFTSCLIDTGGLRYLDVAKTSLIPFLKKNRIYNIETLFITHDDFDHSGASKSLINNFNVKNVVSEKELFPYKIRNLYFKNLNIWNYEDKNDNSLVLYLEIYDKTFLFMGDVSTTVEKEIIKQFPELRVDYLKVGHHGSNTSTCEDFIAYIKPKEAIISCGLNNSFNHPNQETLDVLNKYNVKIRRTDEEGTIVYNV